ncbi:MAG: TonB-dependent receptor [Nevskia sp.]
MRFHIDRAWGPIALSMLALLPKPGAAAGVPGEATELGAVNVTANKLVGESDSATIGTVYSEQFENRPISRPGEILEVVPGLIVTQHSGEGKANQYFLRGYNLDHGTDFAIFVDGLPVNQPTHAHGQGYADNGFFIPELVDSVLYRKGPYYVEYGDFSEAGAADIRYKEHFDRNLFEATGGYYGYGRLLGVGSYKIGPGELVVGAEYVHYDAPYELKESFNKGNLVLRYAGHHEGGSYHVLASAYSTRNLSPDQIPQRAVDQGLIGLYGFIDPTDGGRSHRVNFSGGLDQQLGPGHLSFAAYAFRYQLDLYSDFTYFLDNPVDGDQFNQFDKRNVYGGSAVYKIPAALFGLKFDNEVGVQTRYDDILKVALYRTARRQRLSTTSDDSVQEWNSAAFAQTSFRLTDWARASLGLRAENLAFDVQVNTAGTPAAIARNSGSGAAKLISPKGALIFGPFHKTEFFINAGQGYHSNDVRGATEHIDPVSGDPRDPVTPLVPARGLDLGLRSALVPHVQLAASVFRLSSASELVYNGDAGDTSPNRASVRYGGELAVYYRPIPHLVIDSDIAYTRARYKDHDPVIGDHVPQAVQGVAALGLTYESPQGWDASLRARYFGKRPLIEDASVVSKATTVVNVGIGYRLTQKLKIAGQINNLFDSKDHDIDYYYSSRLQGEPADGVNDTHFHVIEPINGRVTLSYTY